MKHTTVRLLCVASLITVFLTACGGTSGNQSPPSNSTQGNVTVTDVTKTYTGFVKNWDLSSNPVLYALIQNSAEWNAVFENPEQTSSFLLASTYDKDEFLVVSRVVPMVSGMNPDTVFQVDSVEGGDDLVVKYRYVEPSGSKLWYGKMYFILKLAKQPYKRIIFVENGSQIGTLNVANGQWSVPALQP